MVTRLRSLLTTRAAKLSDLVEVERELGRAITELEQMEGERRFMRALRLPASAMPSVAQCLDAFG